MIGTRIEYGGDGIPAPGSYWRDSRNGEWGAATPNGHLANLSAHSVIEHDDGTITVSPSILVSVPSQHPADWSWTKSGPEYPVRGEELWHGFLERGVWREC